MFVARNILNTTTKVRHIKRILPTNSSSCKSVQIVTSRCCSSTTSSSSDVMKNTRLFKSLGASPQEVQSYLKIYQATDSRKFGVIKVGGGVIQDNLDDLVDSITTLTKFGFFPIIVHGAGPQMNSTLQKMGIPSSYDEGLRITTLDILKVARKIFVEANFRLVSFSLFYICKYFLEFILICNL